MRRGITVAAPKDLSLVCAATRRIWVTRRFSRLTPSSSRVFSRSTPTAAATLLKAYVGSSDSGWGAESSGSALQWYHSGILKVSLTVSLQHVQGLRELVGIFSDRGSEATRSALSDIILAAGEMCLTRLSFRWNLHRVVY